ncbi:MFS transporter [Nocardioides campestrisoli]|uniref:MFS transporter n=1 Tax=Nocardioides campestrisoli TaxID=2736757 RepID=UPI001CD5BA2C|nr:MFS transporter [Nocardioides campestrisoli]
MLDSPPGATDARVTSASAKVVVAVLCVGSLCASLMQSLVIPIQGDLPRLLDTSVSNASWVLTATLLAAAVAMPVTGRIADLAGKKPVLVVSAGLLALGSLLCAVSSSLPVVLTGRVLQGVAMGFVPVAISLVREVTPPHLVNTATAAVSATLGVGGALGLPLAAWIAQSFDWHALFWLSTVLAVMVAALTAALVPHVKDEHPGRLDLVGAIGLAIGLVAVLVGVSKGTGWGWTDSRTLGCVVGGAVVLMVWGFYELGHRDPLVDLRTTVKRPVLLTNLAALMIGFGMMAQAIVVPQLLQLPEATGFGLGQSILQAGLWMAPGGVTMMLFTPVSSRMLSRVGGRVTLFAGALVISLGYVVATFLTDAPWQLMLASCVVSAGVGIGYAAMPTLILENVPEEEAGSSVGVNALMRSVGTTVAGAVMAALLSSRTISLAPGVPEIPGHDAFRLCFIVGAASAALGAAIVLLIPRGVPGAVPGELEPVSRGR